jgi:hypothetical protein
MSAPIAKKGDRVVAVDTHVPMFTLSRLPVARQRRVAQSLAELSADKNAAKSLHPAVKAALLSAVAGGERLDVGRELPPLVLDNATDTVMSGFDGVIDGIQRGMDDRVIAPLPPEQARKKAAAATLRLKAIPGGMPFLTLSMPLQYDAMRAMMDKLEKDTECVAAVKELGLGYFVEHMAAHLLPYGRAVRAADGRDLEAESDAFHAAFLDLAIKTTAHHGDDETLRKRVLRAYEVELEAHREEQRARRKRAGSGQDK